MSTEERPYSRGERLIVWGFVVACVAIGVATIASQLGFSWRWPLRISGSFFLLAGVYALIRLVQRDGTEPRPLRYWLARIPATVVASALIVLGVFHWTR